MKSSIDFEKEFRATVEDIGASFSDYPWENEAAYTAWLAQTYYYVKHTMTMIVMVASRFGAREPERFNGMLKHLSEERGHDQLLVRDLEHFEEKTSDYVEDVVTQLFHQNQYYMIQNEGPAAHIGYALLLEAMCAQFGPKVYQRVCKAYGKPSATFLEVHVIADQSHAEEGFKELAALAPDEATAVLKNVKQSSLLYKQILMNCAQGTVRKQILAAA